MISQFTSMATVPNVPGQYWGGTQDNGTLRKSLANNRWFDQASGDGGQVIVDQTTPNTLNPAVPAFVFGTYFGISPYRYTDGGFKRAAPLPPGPVGEFQIAGGCA